jgi:hypothetical protein
LIVKKGDSMSNKPVDRLFELLKTFVFRLIWCLSVTFKPWLWVPIARRLRTSDEGGPPMLLVAVAVSMAFGIGMLKGSIFALGCLYVLGMGLGVVAFTASSFTLFDSLRNLWRFRFRAVARPRFWFEIARTACIVSVIVGPVPVAASLLGVPLSDPIGSSLLYTSFICVALFFVAATAGYMTRMVTRRPKSGRAGQCVNFFYPQCFALLLFISFFYFFRRQLDNPNFYGPVLWTIVALCLTVALALVAMKRWKRFTVPNFGRD